MMGKGARLKRRRKEDIPQHNNKWSTVMTKNFQREIRNSEIWDQMVAEFGEEKAEQHAPAIDVGDTKDFMKESPLICNMDAGIVSRDLL